jgi:putative endopeptidase
MIRSRHFVIALLLAVAVPLAAQQQQGNAAASAVSPFDVSNRDTTCAACADFYRFANGGWVSRATIPGAYPMWGTLIQLQESTEKQYRTVVEDAAKNVATAPRGSDEWKIGTLYNACMDSTRIESLGAAPLDPAMKAIAKIRSSKDVAKALVTMESLAGMAPISAGEAADFRNSKVMVTQLGQGGLTLPDRDFYFRADQRSAAMRKLLVEHMGKMFQLLGDSPEQATANAQTVMNFELRLASASMNIAQMRNPAGVYNRMTVDSLERMVPRLQLKKFLAAQGVKTKEVVVNQPAFLRTLDSMVVDVPAADWRTYYRWRVVNSAAGALSSPFVNENFAFRRNFGGQRELLPRQRRCLATANGVLGEAVGREYVKHYFTPEAKAAALELIGNLQEVLRERIAALDWMSDATKQEALAKLQAVTKKIGYPDQWRDYSKLEIRGEFYADMQRARRWSNERNWAKADKPVNRAEWFVNPQTVDAFYNPLNNEIVFPAGILQAPVFDANADLALNYGAIGAVIGHEMTHGFDDQGRRFDAAGNLRDWWTADDASRYEAKAKLVVDQFNGYTVLDSATHVNGKQTLGENISDLGGLTIAYYAMQKALAKHGRPGAIEGFTQEQRFFLAYANVWRRVARPEYVRQAVNVDVHAPWELRVNGPLSNMPEFRQAWGCGEGEGMVRVDSLRARIW